MKTIKELNKSIGGLTKTTKLDYLSYSIPAKECITGSKLRKKENSVCSDCYAMKGNYKLYEKSIDRAQYNRLNILSSELTQWINDFSEIVKRKKLKKFRWHDSGDIQSIEHFKAIIQIAKNNPDTKFWIPTREYGFYMHVKNDIPNNLIVRVSHPMVNAVFASGKFKNHSAVITKDYINKFLDKYSEKNICPSYKTAGKCAECTKCWDNKIDLIAYIKH